MRSKRKAHRNQAQSGDVAGDNSKKIKLTEKCNLQNIESCDSQNEDVDDTAYDKTGEVTETAVETDVEQGTAGIQNKSEVEASPVKEANNTADSADQKGSDKDNSNSSVDKLHVVGDRSCKEKADNTVEAKDESKLAIEALKKENKHILNKEVDTEQYTPKPSVEDHESISKALSCVSNKTPTPLVEMNNNADLDHDKDNSNEADVKTKCHEDLVGIEPDKENIEPAETEEIPTSQSSTAEHAFKDCSVTTMTREKTENSVAETHDSQCDTGVQDPEFQDVGDVSTVMDDITTVADDITTVADDITDSQLCALDWSSQFPLQTGSSNQGQPEPRQVDPNTGDPSPHPAMENPLLENATAVVVTLIKELQQLNRSLLKTKREMETTRRQRLH